MARLKRETAPAHQALETRLDLLRPGLTLAEYKRLLARFYGFYRPWEQAAFPVLEEARPGLAAGRRKVHLLEADLRSLGVGLEELPVSGELPPLRTTAQVLGSFYVLEGATLGGQVLSRHFSRLLGLEMEGMRFFSGYGEETGPMWQAFREAMAASVAPAEEEAVVRSAVATFEALSGWLLRKEP
jgi:heme oxygenase (biliverdin-IX-beta and delta-forming)